MNKSMQAVLLFSGQIAGLLATWCWEQMQTALTAEESQKVFIALAASTLLFLLLLAFAALGEMGHAGMTVVRNRTLFFYGLCGGFSVLFHVVASKGSVLKIGAPPVMAAVASLALLAWSWPKAERVQHLGN